MKSEADKINDELYSSVDAFLALMQNSFSSIDRSRLTPNLIDTFYRVTNLGKDLTAIPLDLVKQTLADAIDWLEEYKRAKKQTSYTSKAEVADLILFEATLLAPYLTGELRSSGYVDAGIGYYTVGFSAPYAAIVHEDLTVSHPIHENDRYCGGRAKYLEIAVLDVLNKSLPLHFDGNGGIFVEV